MGGPALVKAIPSQVNSARPNVVEVCGLEKRYKKTTAVRGVDLCVDRGEVFGLIGPDGSGKSSLIRAIAGVHQYNAGTIKVFGQRLDSERSAERVKNRLGLMPQGLGNNLYAQLSIEENINYFAGLRLVDPIVLKQRKERLLQMTRLIDFRDRPMKQLSGGMKQKLGLVCTLIHQPELVFLDEPTTGVDPVSRRDFWAILTELVHEYSMTAIVSTAYMDEAAYMDRLALMMDGRVITQGREEDIESLVSGAVVSFPASDALATVDRLRIEFSHAQALGNVVRVFVPNRSRDKAAYMVGGRIGIAATEMTTMVPDLDDVLACLLSTGKAKDFGIGLNSSDNSRLQQRQDQIHNGSRSGTVGKNPSTDSRLVPPIRATHLVRDFGKFRAVDHVSFDVDEGRIFGLLGANGAGKTTVIKMLTGLLPPTSGSGSVAGVDMNRAGHAIKERIGYMSQSFSLYTDMTAIQNLEFYAGVYGLFPRKRRHRISTAIGLIGMEGYEGRTTSDLPMGIRQRLALGCALVHQPRVIFLDEPTSGVDVLGRRQFWDILIRLARNEGVAILVTTHYMTEAEHCDHLALMYAGRIIAAGAPSHLKADLERESGRPLGLVTTSPMKALRIAKQNGFDQATLFGRSLRVLTNHADADEKLIRGALLAEGIEVIGVQHESATMEDVFVHSVLSQEKSDALKSPLGASR